MTYEKGTFIGRLRSKPSHVRHLIAFSMSTAIIALIGIAWAMSLPNRFASGIEGVGAEADTISPFDVFSDSIKEAFPSVVAGVDLEEFNDTAGENLDATSSAWY